MKTALTFFALLALLAGLLWLTSQAPDEQVTAEDLAQLAKMARDTAAAEARLERAAAALCMAEHGPGTTHAWTVDNPLVCHPSTQPIWPRHQAVQLATGSQL